MSANHKGSYRPKNTDSSSSSQQHRPRPDRQSRDNTSEPSNDRKAKFSYPTGSSHSRGSYNRGDRDERIGQFDRQRDRSYGASSSSSNGTYNKNNNNNNNAPRNNTQTPPKFNNNNNNNKTKKSFSEMQLDEPDELPTEKTTKKPLNAPITKLKEHFTPKQLQNFNEERVSQDSIVKTKLQYVPYLGTAKDNLAYKPFINAVHNLGGITQYQLYQLHLYTQCLLASQRHKFDLSVFSDGYYTNQAFPQVPEYFPYLNVTALRRPDLIFNQHLADALSIIPTIEAHVPEITTPNVKTSMASGQTPLTVPLEIVDVGSGGGVPAIILAIMRPSWRITAIDTVGKKCNFLRHTADRLGLGNFTVISGSAQHYCTKANGVQILAQPLEPIEQYGNIAAQTTHQADVSMFEAYDICVARGVTQMPQLLPICMPLVRPGGKFIAMKSLLSSLPQAERQRYQQMHDNTEDNDEVKNDKAIISNLYQGLENNDGGLEIDLSEFQAPAQEGGDEEDDTQNNKSKKAKKADRGLSFKKEQADAVTKMDNFDSLMSTITATPWVPSGRHSDTYAKLSLELQESLPNLQQFGCGKNAKPIYVHTDLFFQVAPDVLKDRGVISDTETDGYSAKDKEGRKNIDAILQQYHPHLFNTTLKPAHDDNTEGKVGETAKYLCVIDKLASLTNKQDDVAVKSRKAIGLDAPKRPKQLTDETFIRASQKYSFLSPLDAVVDDDEFAAQANPKIQLKKKYQNQLKAVKNYGDL